MAFKAFKAYRSKMQELKEFAEDLEDLMDRFDTSEAIFLSLEGKVNDHLGVPLEMMNKTLFKTKLFIDKLAAFIKSYAGKPLRAIMLCATSVMASAIPLDMLDYKDAIVYFADNLGSMPDKKFGKFAQDLHFYVSAAAATASAQYLQNSSERQTLLPKVEPNVPVDSIESIPVTMSPTTLQRQTSRQIAAAEFKDINVQELTQEQIQNKMVELVENAITTDTDDVKVILLKGTSISLTWMFAIWLNNQPHLMYLKFAGRCVDTIQIARAPSTEYVLRIQYEGLNKIFGMDSCAVTFGRAVKEARKQLKLSRWTYFYSGKYYKQVTHKVLLFAALSCSYLGLCLIGSYFNGITISRLEVEGKSYRIQMRESTCVVVNGIVRFDSGKRTSGVGSKYVN